MAAASVTVGGAWGSSNESALAHRHVLRQEQESVYMCPVFTWWTSLETTPVTGSLLDVAFLIYVPEKLFCMCRVILLSCSCLVCGECVGLFFGIIIRLRWRWGATAWQTAGPVSTSTCSYKFFGMEAYVNLDSDSVYELKTVPDVLGLHARQ